MLQIVVPGKEFWNREKNEFEYGPEQILSLEHSLISISKWESKWKKAFLKEGDKTYEEVMDYIRCMTINKNIDPSVYERLSRENIEAINEYINDPMTATKIYVPKERGTRNRNAFTSEVIYYMMISFHIPIEFEKWHINRLLTLIRVCELKNGSQKKMSKSEITRRNAELNAARRARLNTRG